MISASVPATAPRRSPWRGSDLPLAYAAAVLVVSVIIAARPDGHAIVVSASTNLANMRERPLEVLASSLFVVSPLSFLLLLIPVVIAYREVEIWLGRLALLVSVVFCHAFASLAVTVAELVAVADRSVSATIENRSDVGVSYGLAGAIGLLLVRVPRRFRLWYGLASVAGVIILIVSRSTFSALGHGSAWLIGVGLAWLVYAARRGLEKVMVQRPVETGDRAAPPREAAAG